MTTTLEDGQRWMTAFNVTAITIPPYGALNSVRAKPLGLFPNEPPPSTTQLALGVGAAQNTHGQIVFDLDDPGPCFANKVLEGGDPGLLDIKVWSDDVLFNGPIAIPPQREGKVTFDLPTLARVCGSGFSNGYLLAADGEFKLIQRTPSGRQASVFWLLGLLEIIDSTTGICLICRKAFDP